MLNKRVGLISLLLFFLAIGLIFISGTQGQESSAPGVQIQEVPQVVNEAAPIPTGYEKDVTNLTLEFKDADIQTVLRMVALKAGINIVSSPEVAGTVTMRLADVPWEKALDVILKTYGLAYERQANVILVAPMDKMTEMKQKEAELAQIQPTATEVFNLKFIDARDAKKALEPQLSPRGKIDFLEMSGQAGWEFGTSGSTGKRERKPGEVLSRSKVLIVTDIPPALDKVREALRKVDIKPQQVLIEARIIEVRRDFLRDLGLDFGTGQNGATTTAIESVTANKTKAGDAASDVGAQILGSRIEPSVFGDMSGITSTFPLGTGLDFQYRKLTGTQFEILLHALEEDVNTNTLSAPHIITLNNQEATILVGEKYPIVTTEQSTESPNVFSVTLDHYEDIGIQLNVSPQIAGEDYINMVLHPAVTDKGTNVATNYPIINTREAETRVLVKDGETIVIGGLMQDVISKSVIGVPFLKDIPWIGKLFRRDTTDTLKKELLIFVTAKILKGDATAEAKIAEYKDGYSQAIDYFKKTKAADVINKEEVFGKEPEVQQETLPAPAEPEEKK